MIYLCRLGALLLWFHCYSYLSFIRLMSAERIARVMLPAFGLYLLLVMATRYRVGRQLKAVYAEYSSRFGTPPELFLDESIIEAGGKVGLGAELAGLSGGEGIGSVVGIVVAEAKRAWDRRSMSAEQLALYDRLARTQGLYNRLHPLAQLVFMLVLVGLTWLVMQVGRI